MIAGASAAVILSIEAHTVERALSRLMSRNRPSIRDELTEFAVAEGYAL